MSARHVSRDSIAWLVVVVAIVLAGCNAFSGSSAGGGVEAPTEGMSSPAAVPTDSPTPTPSPADVPGLSATGVVDGEALLDAHTEIIEERSFTIEHAERAELDNDTVVNRTHTTAWVGADGRIRMRSVRASPPAVVSREPDPTQRELWVGSARSFKALSYPNDSTEYVRVPQDARVKRSLTRDSVGVVASLDPDSSRVVRRVRTGGETLYLIEGRTQWLGGTNDTHRFLVGPSGRVRNLTTIRAAVQEPDVESKTFTVRYSRVGNTTVERPEWYEAAVENTTGSADSTREAGASAQEVESSTRRSGTPSSPREPAASTAAPPGSTSNASLAPGLARDGVTDPVALASAHADVLDRASFTYRSRAVERYANGTLRARTVANGTFGPRESGLNTTFERTASTESGPAIRRRAWSDGERLLVATTRERRTRYALALDREVLTPATPRVLLHFDPTSRERLARLLDGVAVSVTERDESGTYTLVTAGMERPDRIGTVRGLASVQAVSLTAVVEASGLVRRYRVEYIGTTTSGTTIQGTRSVRYTGVGSTTVERPAWYGAAIENTTDRATGDTEAGVTAATTATSNPATTNPAAANATTTSSRGTSATTTSATPARTRSNASRRVHRSR